MKNRNRKTESEDGSGNVFADLGLDVADDLQVREQIGFGVFTILGNRNLKYRETAGLLKIPQPEGSHLMNGRFSRHTTEKLSDFLKRLNGK